MFNPVSGFTLPKVESGALTVTTYSLSFVSFLVFLYASFRAGRHLKTKFRSPRKASRTTTTTGNHAKKYVSPWKVLGVPYGASESEIRKRYHQLALTYHPDKNVDDSESADQMMRINAAYRVLNAKPVTAPLADDNAQTQMPYSPAGPPLPAWQDYAADIMARAGAQTQGVIDGLHQFKFTGSGPMSLASQVVVFVVASYLCGRALGYLVRLGRVFVRKVRVFMRVRDGDPGQMCAESIIDVCVKASHVSDKKR